MSEEAVKKVGLIIGREWSWPSAFISEVNKRNAGVTAEFAKLGGTFLDSPVEYAVIIDRMSQEIPYYRAYLKYAAMQGAYIINNPFTWDGDDRFIGMSLAQTLGYEVPKSVVLPNKRVETQVVPESFRNLDYPMNWRGIIDYVGVPAILKSADASGGHESQRVYDVDDLIQKYDESDTLTMIVQEIVEPGEHVHVFTVGRRHALPVRYSLDDGTYLADTGDLDLAEMKTQALAISEAYGYDMNMVEFIMRDDVPVVINPTNPAPDMDINRLKPSHFSWCVNKMADFAVEMAHLAPTALPAPHWQPGPAAA